MRLASETLLALKLLWRDYRAGELTLIAIAIAIAVASVTTIGFFTDRVHQALGRQANQLLGADLVIVSDRPLAPELEAEARARGLAVTRMVRFPSMAIRDDRSTLASLKAVTEGYPLRGEMRTSQELYGRDQHATAIPQLGQAWVDERLFSQLALRIGEAITLGQSRFVVTAIVTHEPDAAIGFINSAPRVLINEADLAGTGLVQPGSRVNYRLQIAGRAESVDVYRAWAEKQLKAGQRIEG